MKWTPKKLVFTILEITFAAVVPAALIITNYASWSEEATGFKISLGGVMLFLLLFYIVKKLLLNKYTERLKSKINQHMADLEVEVNQERIESLKEALKKERTVECVLNFIIPALLLVLLFIVCKALEVAAVKMSGTVGLIGASEVVGLLFSILSARQVEGKR